MDKIKLTAFGPMPKFDEIEVTIGETSFSVKPVIPYEEVLDGMQWAIDFIIGGRGFISEPLYEIMRDLALIRSYTNIDLSQIDEIDFNGRSLYETYDLAVAHGVVAEVKSHIDADQLAFFDRTLTKTLKSMVDYKNSASGIIEQLSQDSANSSAKLSEAMNILNQEGNMDLIQKFIDAYSKDQPKI